MSIKVEKLEFEGSQYEVIPPAPTSTERGGIIASTKTDDYTTEAKLGSDGKLYVPKGGGVDSLSDLGITATAAELNYMDGVTSNVQTQLNGKAPSSHTHNILTLAGTNVAWNGTDWNGGTRQYYYEGANVTNLNLPHPHVVVIVSKQGTGRGIALAYAWNSGFQGRTWINCLHDSWSGWKETTSTTEALASSSSTLIGTASSGFNTTIDAKYHSLYLTGSVGSSGTMNLMFDMRYPRAGLSVSQSMAHGNSSINFTVSGNKLKSSGSSNGVSVYGLYYS